jgi:hypothetical protein
MCTRDTPGADSPARIGHELANKLTAQIILLDLLVELTEGEAAELARQLSDETRGIADLATRLRSCVGAPAASPRPG